MGRACIKQLLTLYSAQHAQHARTQLVVDRLAASSWPHPDNPTAANQAPPENCRTPHLQLLAAVGHRPRTHISHTVAVPQLQPPQGPALGQPEVASGQELEELGQLASRCAICRPQRSPCMHVLAQFENSIRQRRKHGKSKEGAAVSQPPNPPAALCNADQAVIIHTGHIQGRLRDNQLLQRAVGVRRREVSSTCRLS